MQGKRNLCNKNLYSLWALKSNKIKLFLNLSKFGTVLKSYSSREPFNK